MSKPLVITISHQLSRQEVKSRLQDNMERIHSQLAPYTNAVDSHWTEDRLDFRVAAVGQTVTGQIEVLDDAVRVEVHLPWMLSWLGTLIGDRVRQQGRLMLTKR
jgi:hypothetical protein